MSFGQLILYFSDFVDFILIMLNNLIDLYFSFHDKIPTIGISI